MKKKLVTLNSRVKRILSGAESKQLVKPKNDALNNGNKIINHPNLKNSSIGFRGKGNILYCEDESLVLENSKIMFHGNDSIIYLSKNKHRYGINISVYNNSSVFIGSDNYFNGRLTMIAAEQKNIVIGHSGLFSFGSWIRTSDPHLVYDGNTKKRLNYSKSVLIGDHVWIGQGVILLKGSRIGSGSIVGAASVVAGKELISNASYAGAPVRKIRDDVFFLGNSVNKYTDKQTQESDSSETQEWMYESTSKQTITYNDLESHLGATKTIKSKLDYMKNVLSSKSAKNRFFIGDN